MHINVLDLGSNSFHLLQARLCADRSVECLGGRKHLVRLGDKAFQQGEIDAADWRTGMSALGDLLRTARATSNATVVAVATSVFRDARNGRAFLDDVRRVHGLDVELLSEGIEAELSLRGALQLLGPRAATGGELALVVDMGGGSLELALGDRTRCVAQHSLPFGVLRLRNACLPADRVLRADGIARVESLVRDALVDTAPALRAQRPAHIVLSSGTARRVAKLSAAEQLRPGEWRLSRRAIGKLVEQLTDKTPAQLTARGVPSARADTLGAGAVALATLLDELGADRALVTRTGLREGVAARAAERCRSAA